MLYKCYWIVLYIVHVTAFCLGGRFFPDTVYVFRLVLKPCNESQLVLRPKGKLFQTRGAATRLPNIVLQ